MGLDVFFSDTISLFINCDFFCDVLVAVHLINIITDSFSLFITILSLSLLVHQDRFPFYFSYA